jgi:hypothetical protein
MAERPTDATPKRFERRHRAHFRAAHGRAVTSGASGASDASDASDASGP